MGFGRIRFRMIVIVAGLVFDRRDVVDGAVKAFGVVPVDPLIGGPFNLFPGGECSHPGMVVDLLAVKQPDNGLHEPVIPGITDGADRDPVMPSRSINLRS